MLFSESVKESIYDLKVFDEELMKLSYDFLKRYYDLLADFEKIEKDTVQANNLYCFDKFMLFNRIPLKRYRRLFKMADYENNIDVREKDLDILPFCDARFIKYKIDRINYGERPEIILFDGSNIVRDGRLLAIAYMYVFGKNCTIPVKRVYLKHRINDRIFKENIRRLSSSVIKIIISIFRNK